MKYLILGIVRILIIIILCPLLFLLAVIGLFQLIGGKDTGEDILMVKLLLWVDKLLINNKHK